MDADERDTLERHLRAEAAHDAGAAAACYCPDGWYEHRALGLRFDGRDAVEAQYALSYETFPDMVFVVEDAVEGDHAVVQRGRIRGTFAGPFLAFGPTGRQVNLPMTASYTFRDGLILGEHIDMDLSVFAEQTGLDLGDLQSAVGIETEAARAWAAVSRYAEAKSRADVDAALGECTDDFELCTVPFGITSHGAADSRAGLEMWFTAFPDYDVTVDGHLASARTVTCWGVIAATMRGDLGPLRATGARYRLPFSCVFAVEDGRIRREEFHFDLARMALQLGLDLDEAVALLGLAEPAST